jgi:hypothetical protein
MQRLRPLISLAALSLVLIHTPATAKGGMKGAFPGPGRLPDSICTTPGKAVDEKGYVRIGASNSGFVLKAPAALIPSSYSSTAGRAIRPRRLPTSSTNPGKRTSPSSSGTSAVLA